MMAKANYTLHLLVIVLFCSYLISSNAISVSRLTNLQSESEKIMDAKSMNQNQMNAEDKMQEVDSVEGRMEIEKNDYGATGSNPIHTPRPPLT